MIIDRIIVDDICTKLQQNNVFTVARRNVNGQELLYHSIKYTNQIYVLSELKMQQSSSVLTVVFIYFITTVHFYPLNYHSSFLQQTMRRYICSTSKINFFNFSSYRWNLAMLLQFQIWMKFSKLFCQTNNSFFSRICEHCSFIIGVTFFNVSIFINFYFISLFHFIGYHWGTLNSDTVHITFTSFVQIFLEIFSLIFGCTANFEVSKLQILSSVELNMSLKIRLV